jgi:hypothetical protein
LERRSENSNLSHKNIKCGVTDVAGKGHHFVNILFLASIYEHKQSSENRLVA